MAQLFLDLYQGRVRWMRDRTARACRCGKGPAPGYGAVLAAYHGFGLETGDYAHAEDESQSRSRTGAEQPVRPSPSRM